MENGEGGKKIFYRYLRKNFPYVDYENYLSEESTIDDDEDYADGMNHYYENNRDALDEADLYSEDSCFEDGSVASDDSDTYYYINPYYEDNYYDLLFETYPPFEEYSDTTEDSDFFYKDDESVYDLGSYYEDTDEDSDSCCVDNYDSTNDLDPFYEERQRVDEDSEIARRSNLSVEEIITTNESSVLLLFYAKLLEDLMQNFFVSSSDVRSSIRLLIECYSLVNHGQLPLEIDFNSMQYCLGYLHRYGACHMALVLEAVSSMLESSPVLLSMLNKKKLNVVFLGGGPGNDLLGFLAALHGHHNLLALDVAVVDKMPGWASVFMETVKRLRRGDFHLAGRVFNDINVTPSFITADLKEFLGWCDKMQNKLARSDVVFLVKTLSHIPDAEKLDVLENVVIYLKPGALLIYIDFPFPYKTFASLKCLKLVYQSGKTNYDFYSKSIKFGYPNISKCRAEVRVFERL